MNSRAKSGRVIAFIGASQLQSFQVSVELREHLGRFDGDAGIGIGTD